MFYSLLNHILFFCLKFISSLLFFIWPLPLSFLYICFFSWQVDIKFSPLPTQVPPQAGPVCVGGLTNKKPIFIYWKDSNNYYSEEITPWWRSRKNFWTRKHMSLSDKNSIVCYPKTLSVLICLLFLFCFFLGRAFMNLWHGREDACDSVTYRKKKTRERDMECDGVSVARGWRVPFLLGEQGFGMSLAMGRTSEKNILDSQSFILFFYIFSMECILVGVFFFFLSFLAHWSCKIADKCRLCSHYWISLADTFTIDSCEIFTWSHRALNWSGMRFWGLLEDKDSIISTFLYLFQPRGWGVLSAAFCQPGWDWTGCTCPLRRTLGENGFRQFIFFLFLLLPTDGMVMHIHYLDGIFIPQGGATAFWQPDQSLERSCIQ